jgi:predicted PurR-regulated permease PerM
MSTTSSIVAPDASATPVSGSASDRAGGSAAVPDVPPETVAPRFGAVEIAVLVLAALAAIAAAKIAQPFLVPLIAGILLAYPLRPAVNALERLRVPRFGGATLVMLALMGIAGASAYLLHDDLDDALAQLPGAARKIRIAFEREAAQKAGPIAHVKEAAAELERAVEAPARRPGEQAAAPPAPAPAPGAQIQSFVTRQTAGALTVAGQIGVALLLTYFLLGTGDAFRRKCARIAGASLARRRVTVEVLNEIDAQVQAYMLILIVPNILIGVATWLALAAVGLPNAGLWGAFVGGVHILPYVGTVIGAFAVGAASLVANGSLADAALAMGIVVAIATAIGMGLATWLQGRACQMNVVAVYVGLIFFGWLWGGWGLVLGFPLLAVLKSIADRVDAMLPIRELLAE